jgi:hypothetical protein
MNSVKEALEPSEESPNVGDYFVVDAYSSTWYISPEMATAVDADLAAVPQPEWTVFVDLAGARVRLRTARIEYLSQCTAEQRATRRTFLQRLKREERGDERPWDD